MPSTAIHLQKVTEYHGETWLSSEVERQITIEVMMAMKSGLCSGIRKDEAGNTGTPQAKLQKCTGPVIPVLKV